ncbi:ribosomal L7Ae/L30e/S12e/Gadd45 family protein [Candidatus Woesearchaeota archaeon]|nr:ribosomal L7Ae/L30e/S12e/Gadd45 family protein [Candidatus Woesearchaeota archaeon]
MAKNEEAALKKSLNEGKVVIGTQQVVKLLKQGKLKRIYLSSNCPAEVIADLEHYSKLAKTEIVKLSQSNEELGTFCKKPFSISVLGVR